MTTITNICLVAGIFFQFTAVDPTFHPDDLISLSCPKNDTCYLLDEAGNLLFTEGSADKLVERAHLADIGLRKIEFLGLLRGWGLDKEGGIWRTRDGGKRFVKIRGPAAAGVVEIQTAADSLWVATVSRWIYRSGKAGAMILVARSPASLFALAVSNDGDIAVLSSDTGQLYLTNDRGAPWLHSSPLPSGAKDVAFGPGGNVIVTGCRGRIGVCDKSGKRLRTIDISDVPGFRAMDCLSTGAFLPDGRMAVADRSGAVLFVDTNEDKLDLVPIAGSSGWNDIERRGDDLLLAGATGRLARIHAPRDKEPRLVEPGRVKPAIVNIETTKKGHFWMSSVDGNLFSSFDNGQSWQRAHAQLKDVVALSTPIENTLFALVDSNRIYGSKNRGRTWTRLGVWPELHLSDLYFIDRRRGWAVGDSGCFIHTADGGKTWTQDRLPEEIDLYRVGFVVPGKGFAAGEGQSVFKTIDGGRTWKRVLSGDKALLAMHFETSELGWVGGEGGVLLATADGGENWTPQKLPGAGTIRAIDFIDSERGLIASDEGRLFLTKNGGASYSRLDLHTRSTWTCVACTSKGDCVLGSAEGQLMKGRPFRFFQ